MNQILATNNLNNEKKYKEKENKEKKHNNYNATSNKSDSKKIIIIFAIIILIFGLIIGAIGIKKFFSNKGQVYIKEPETTMEQTENGIALNIKSESKIKQVAYCWNDGDKVVENINDSSIYSTIIDAIGGENTLFVTVTDENGKIYEYSQQFTNDDIDNIQPEVKYDNISEDENGKKIMEVVATDETEIDYITYKWNEEEAVKISAEQGETILKANIEILEGDNKLTIVAMDKAGNEKKISEIPVKGLKKPEIQVVKTNDTITMTIKHDVGIKKIEFIINGKTYFYDETSSIYEENKKILEIPFTLKEGENNVTINAESVENIQAQYVGKCTYEP